MTPWRRRQDSSEPSATSKLMSDLERFARLEPELNAARKREQAALMVRGRPIFDWQEEIASLKRRGSLHEALELLMECIAATERQQDLQRRHAPLRAAAHGGLEEDYRPRETPPWWTEQAAIILRKQGDIEGELAVLDRWFARAGDPARWVGARHSRLVERRHAVSDRLRRGSPTHEAHEHRH